jgi:hypothetical protein
MSRPTAEGPTSWHDNLIYGLHLRCAEPERGIWRSELVLDIDHILEWLPQPGGGMRFLMVPTVLVFHDVSDLAIALDFGFAAGGRLNLNELSIDAIARDPVPGDAPAYYRWCITLNHPSGGEIRFGASHFTRIPTAPPRLSDEQRYPPEHRPPFNLAALP